MILYLRFLMKEKLDVFIFKIPYFGKVLRDYEISIVFLIHLGFAQGGGDY